MNLSNLTKEELKVVAKYYNLTFNKKITRASLEALIYLAQIEYYMSLHDYPMEEVFDADCEMVEKCEDC